MLEHDDAELVDDYLDDPEEGVNLYELLEIAPDADTKSVRKRIGEMFLEAQNNADHRSFRRRFYYRELMESLLPKARHLLLDAQRREEYNASLGLKPPFAALAITPAKTPEATNPVLDSTAKTSSTSAPTQSAPTQSAPTQSAPTQSAPTQSAPTQSAPTPTAEMTAETSSADLGIDFSNFVEVAPSGEKAAKSSGETASAEAKGEAKPAARRGVTPEHLKMDAERVERRRDEKRRELIKQELMAAGRKGATLAGGGAFLAAGAVLFGLGMMLGISFLQMLSVPVALGLGAFCGRQASRAARKRIIILLSQMPYDQLLKRCARG